MSKLHVEESDTKSGVSVEEYDYSVVMDSVPAAITAKQIERESPEYPLSKIRRGIQKDNWTDLEHTVFKAVRDELWVVGQVVKRGSRIVLPQKLQRRALILAHEGRQDIVLTKTRLRVKVRWPTMDKDVEALVKGCYPCQGRPHCHKSWSDIAIDLCGPLPNGETLLVVIDYFSRWPEVVWMGN